MSDVIEDDEPSPPHQLRQRCAWCQTRLLIGAWSGKTKPRSVEYDPSRCTCPPSLRPPTRPATLRLVAPRGPEERET